MTRTEAQDIGRARLDFARYPEHNPADSSRLRSTSVQIVLYSEHLNRSVMDPPPDVVTLSYVFAMECHAFGTLRPAGSADPCQAGSTLPAIMALDTVALDRSGISLAPMQPASLETLARNRLTAVDTSSQASGFIE